MQLSQKTKLLGSQWVEIQQLQQEKRNLCQQLKDGGNEDRVQALQMKLQSMEQDADGLRINAESHGKQVAFFKAQTTALQMKLKEVVAENARFESLCSAAQSKAEVCCPVQILERCADDDRVLSSSGTNTACCTHGTAWCRIL